MDENCLTIQDLFKTDQDSLVIVIVIVIIFTLGWNVYTFDRILGKRKNPKDRRKWQYHIKLDGFPDLVNSWVAARDIIDEVMLKRYLNSLRSKTCI